MDRRNWQAVVTGRHDQGWLADPRLPLCRAEHSVVKAGPSSSSVAGR
jgi:hypothetical protein